MDEAVTRVAGPKVSVVMPVHNAERYLREAIDSILSQTFADFELLVIDDGSTDRSPEIAASYDDPRVSCLPNTCNAGLVATLNRGVELARGEYIAVMHADDVSLPRRLELQVQFLDTDPSISLVAGKSVLIDAWGDEIGYWQADQLATSFEQIRTTLPKTNCISHPSVMMRRQVAVLYRYDKGHYATEDYDLWLRLVADNHRVGKVDEVLLRYRVHSSSITATTEGDAYKEVRARARFLLTALRTGKARTSFHLEVLVSLLVDMVTITDNQLKARFLAIARAIFISVGKAFGTIGSRLFPQRHGILFFFPFSLDHVGGSERVHADIVAATRNSTPWIILANEWHRNATSPVTAVGCRTTDISRWLCNPFTKNLAVGLFAGYINRQKPILFGGNCEFFYWLLPYLHREICCVDIIHAFDSIMYSISLPHATRINRRIVLAQELQRALVTQYRRNGIPEMCLERIALISYGVDVPDTLPDRDCQGILEVLFVGRGSSEKRVHLVGQIARHLAEAGQPVRVSLVGDVLVSVDVADRAFCTFHGEVHDRSVLDSHYRKSDILVITSISEGVSLVKMEAMAFGVVPVATAVGGIPDDITHGETGFLVSPDQDEDGIVRDFCVIISDLIQNRNKLREIAVCAHTYARLHFDRTRALASFRSLLEGIR